jgi:hypothetical protein
LAQNWLDLGNMYKYQPISTRFFSHPLIEHIKISWYNYFVAAKALRLPEGAAAPFACFPAARPPQTEHLSNVFPELSSSCKSVADKTGLARVAADGVCVRSDAAAPRA